MRAGIYARYSSDNQDERSIEDQVRLCREFAESRGDIIVEIYADYAISGSSLKQRPQALRLLDEARSGRIDVVITEALDRLSRDQEDVAGIFKRLTHAGVTIFTCGEGEINELHIGLKGTMNALFLKDLAAKTRRGQRGRVEAGFAAGGLGYGYSVVREIGADGEITRGMRAIDPTKADVIRRIFDEFNQGKSARAIAAQLNREGVPAPFGKHWNASTINGNPQRGTGILNNAAYIGQLVYNRVRMVKDPDTGKRLSRLNAPSQWITKSVPELRILTDESWSAAQARKRATVGLPLEQRRRAKHLLSGLLVCGCCGGPYVVKDHDSLGCSRHRESGTCDNARVARIGDVEARVLDGLKEKLLAPGPMRAAVLAYQRERQRLASVSRDRRHLLAQRLARLNDEIKRLVDGICAGAATPASNGRLIALDGHGGEREQIEAELARLEDHAKVVKVHPGIAEAYVRMIEDLRGALSENSVRDPERQAEAVAMLRHLIVKIEVLPLPERGRYELRAHGDLAVLLSAATGDRKDGTTGAALTPVALVAGEGVVRYRDASFNIDL